MTDLCTQLQATLGDGMSRVADDHAAHRSSALPSQAGTASLANLMAGPTRA
jgi:hypothetical protein